MNYQLNRTLPSILMLAAWATAGWMPAQAKTTTMACYDAWFDQDGDGYAAKYVNGNPDMPTPVTLVTVSDRALDCPTGYRKRATDCDDLDARVHPRAPEIGYNGVDDNCNGMVDEPVFLYHRSYLWNNRTGFAMRVSLNHPDIRAAARAGTLYAILRYFPLDDVASFVTTGLFPVTEFDDNFLEAQVRLAGLRSGTVYAARLYFYRRDSINHYTDIGPNATVGSSVVDMERYYTMTDSSFDRVHRRFEIVMKALYEFNASALGQVGYWGSLARDGTRYDASLNENWCSEFYSWNVRDELEGFGDGTTVRRVLEYFDDRGGLQPPSEIATADPGDYLAIDPEQDADPSHSGMFLAYDAGTGMVWSVEGNSGNEVKVKQQAADWGVSIPAGKKGPYFVKLGHIRTSMWR